MLLTLIIVVVRSSMIFMLIGAVFNSARYGNIFFIDKDIFNLLMFLAYGFAASVLIYYKETWWNFLGSKVVKTTDKAFG